MNQGFAAFLANLLRMAEEVKDENHVSHYAKSRCALGSSSMIRYLHLYHRQSSHRRVPPLRAQVRWNPFADDRETPFAGAHALQDSFSERQGQEEGQRTTAPVPVVRHWTGEEAEVAGLTMSEGVL